MGAAGQETDRQLGDWWLLSGTKIMRSNDHLKTWSLTHNKYICPGSQVDSVCGRRRRGGGVSSSAVECLTQSCRCGGRKAVKEG